MSLLELLLVGAGLKAACTARHCFTVTLTHDYMQVAYVTPNLVDHAEHVQAALCYYARQAPRRQTSLHNPRLISLLISYISCHILRTHMYMIIHAH